MRAWEGLRGGQLDRHAMETVRALQQGPAWLLLHGRIVEQYRLCYWACMRIISQHMHTTAANRYAATSTTVDEGRGTLRLAPQPGHHKGATLSRQGHRRQRSYTASGRSLAKRSALAHPRAPSRPSSAAPAPCPCPGAPRAPRRPARRRPCPWTTRWTPAHPARPSSESFWSQRVAWTRANGLLLTACWGVRGGGATVRLCQRSGVRHKTGHRCWKAVAPVLIETHQHVAKDVVGLVIVKVLVGQAAADVAEDGGVPAGAQDIVHHMLRVYRRHVRQARC